MGPDHYDKPLDGDFIFLNDGGRNVVDILLSPFKTKDAKGAALAHYLEVSEVTLCLSQDRCVKCKCFIIVLLFYYA